MLRGGRRGKDLPIPHGVRARGGAVSGSPEDIEGIIHLHNCVEGC